MRPWCPKHYRQLEEVLCYLSKVIESGRGRATIASEYRRGVQLYSCVVSSLIFVVGEIELWIERTGRVVVIPPPLVESCLRP